MAFCDALRRWAWWSRSREDPQRGGAGMPLTGSMPREGRKTWLALTDCDGPRPFSSLLCVSRENAALRSIGPSGAACDIFVALRPRDGMACLGTG